MKFNFNIPYNKNVKSKEIKESFDFNNLDDEDTEPLLTGKLRPTEYILHDNLLEHITNIINQCTQKTAELSFDMQSAFEKYTAIRGFYSIFASSISIDLYYKDESTVNIRFNIYSTKPSLYRWALILINSLISYFILWDINIDTIQCRVNSDIKNPLSLIFNNIDELETYANKCANIKITAGTNTWDEVSSAAYPLLIMFGCDRYDDYVKGLSIINNSEAFSNNDIVYIIPTQPMTNFIYNEVACHVSYVCQSLMDGDDPVTYMELRHIKCFSVDYINKRKEKYGKHENPYMTLYQLSNTPSLMLLYIAWSIYNDPTIKITPKNMPDFYKKLSVTSMYDEVSENTKNNIEALSTLFNKYNVTPKDFAAMYLYLSSILDKS